MDDALKETTRKTARMLFHSIKSGVGSLVSDSGAGTPVGALIAGMSTDASGRWKLAMRLSTAPCA